jgi:hypothetical protein
MSSLDSIDKDDYMSQEAYTTAVLSAVSKPDNVCDDKYTWREYTLRVFEADTIGDRRVVLLHTLRLIELRDELPTADKVSVSQWAARAMRWTELGRLQHDIALHTKTHEASVGAALGPLEDWERFVRTRTAEQEARLIETMTAHLRGLTEKACASSAGASGPAVDPSSRYYQESSA